MKLGLKSLFSFSLLILSGTVALSASLGPNTAIKFVGTWKAADGSHIYMGPADAFSHRGAYIVETARGQRYEHVYEVLDMDEVANKILIEIKFYDERIPVVQHELVLQKDPTLCVRRIVSPNLPLLKLNRMRKEPTDTLVYLSRNSL